MMTFKQLEAVFWIVKAGGFSQAAVRLHTSQAAVSKRVQELESSFDIQIFDRSGRSARLTERGEAFFLVASQLLEKRDAAIEELSRPDVIARRLRLGITELTAMTWLPKLVASIHAYFPKVVLEPTFDSSIGLRDRLLNQDLDVVFVAEHAPDELLLSTPIGAVQHAWFCKPGLLPHDRAIHVHDLVKFPLLTQGAHSGTGRFYDAWLRQRGIRPTETITVGNLVAAIGLTMSGLGVSYMPRECLRPLIRSAQLMEVQVLEPLPPIPYVGLQHAEQGRSFLSSIVMLAQECCNFNEVFQH